MLFVCNGYEGLMEILVLVMFLQFCYYDEMKDLYVNRLNVNGIVICFYMVFYLVRYKQCFFGQIVFNMLFKV